MQTISGSFTCPTCDGSGLSPRWGNGTPCLLCDGCGSVAYDDKGRLRPADFQARKTRTCAECGRAFDLTDAADAGEWFFGHDCEVG